MSSSTLTLLRRRSLWLAGLLALSACGPLTHAEPDDDAIDVSGALTRPLQPGIARRVYGDAGQVRSYTMKVADGDALDVALSGTGSVTLNVKSADGTQTCTRSPGMAHRCSFTTPGTGTWAFELTGLADFSGSLLVTVLEAIPDGGSPSPTEPEPSDGGHGPLGAGAAVSPHTTLGLPGQKALAPSDNWLLVKPQYVVSYDSAHKVPNWVSWELTPSWLGSATRTSTFSPDPDLPNTTPQGTNRDFDGSGYARGHMCPSGDRTSNSTDNRATFWLTNVVPQAPTLNNGPWKALENEERQLAATGKTVFVIAGPILGTATIGADVSVPVATWKVVVVLDGAATTSSSVSEKTHVIAVIMPNDTTATKEWTEYRTTVRDIEAKTGLDLLSDVATAIQEIIETRVDTTVPL